MNPADYPPRPRGAEEARLLCRDVRIATVLRTGAGRIIQSRPKAAQSWQKEVGPRVESPPMGVIVYALDDPRDAEAIRIPCPNCVEHPIDLATLRRELERPGLRPLKIRI